MNSSSISNLTQSTQENLNNIDANIVYFAKNYTMYMYVGMHTYITHTQWRDIDVLQYMSAFKKQSKNKTKLKTNQQEK